MDKSDKGISVKLSQLACGLYLKIMVSFNAFIIFFKCSQKNIVSSIKENLLAIA